MPLCTRNVCTSMTGGRGGGGGEVRGGLETTCQVYWGGGASLNCITIYMDDGNFLRLSFLNLLRGKGRLIQPVYVHVYRYTSEILSIVGQTLTPIRVFNLRDR